MLQEYPLVRLNRLKYDYHELVVAVVVVGDVAQEEEESDNIANIPVDHIELVCRMDDRTMFRLN